MMQEISVSEIQIIPVKPNNGLQAFVSFVLNNSFYCADIALHGRSDGSGYRLVYPDRVLRNGCRVQILHPISRLAAIAIETPVFEAYEKLIQKSNQSEARNVGRIET